MSSWYVCRTATRQEGRALKSLAELGFAAYLPQLTRWKRTARAKEKITSPLFVGYMFVSLDDGDFWKAGEADGVHTILRTKGAVPRPLAVSCEVVEAIRSAEARGEFDKTRRTRPDPAPGSQVKIVGGKFQGFPAEFVKRRDDERIEVLFQMFGRWSPLTLKAGEVSGFAEEDAA